MKIRDRVFIFGLFLFTAELFATPEFAREYSVDCATCHTMIPLLNDTGKSFLRNGFRFSSEDRPTLKKIISPNKGESRPIPFSVMFGGNYDTNSEDFQTKLKLYTGGTITKNLSFFGVTQDNFNSNNNNDNHDLFSQKSSRFYGKVNINGEKHSLRVGLISPLREFGNIFKISSDSGLQGHMQPTQQNSTSNRGGGGNRGYGNSSYQKYGNQTSNSNFQGGQGDRGLYSNNSNNTTHNTHQGGGAGGGNRHYQTALQHASVGMVKGVEYSYLFDNKLLALVSYGEIVNKSNQGQNSRGHGQGQNQNSLVGREDSDDYQFVGGLEYIGDSRYSIGVIYNRYEKMGQDNFSLLIPIEKSFDNAQLISTLVYRDETAMEDSYYGIENSLIYSITATDYIRGIIDYGVFDDKDSYGLSLTYSKAFKYLLFHITGARRDSGDSGENLVLGSVSLLF